MHGPEALFGEGEENLVLAREVAVDGGRAVLNTFGDAPHRHRAIAFGDEQLARGVEDGVPHGRAIAVLAFLDSHGRMNDVLDLNGVW